MSREVPSKGLALIHVLACQPFGGLESVVRTLAEGQTKRRHRVRVVAVLDLEPSPHPFELALRDAGIEVTSLRLPPRAYRRERGVLATLFRELRPALVHTHGYRADVQAGAVAHRLGIPTLATVHGFTGGGWKNRLYEWLQLRALGRSDAVVAVSKPLVGRLRARGVAAQRIHCVPNAWGGRGALLSREEARRGLALPDDAFVVGWVGRLSAEKGPDVLLDALARMKEAPVSCCVIGDGPDRGALVRRAARLGLGESVHWSGSRPDAGRLFAAFDAFALSSRTEGTPIVLFEAMDAGVPIVASRVGGVPDVVGEREAWLVEPADPEALAGALVELRGNRREAARRAEAAQQRLSAKFRVEPWLDAYEAIYRRLGYSGSATAGRGHD